LLNSHGHRTLECIENGRAGFSGILRHSRLLTARQVMSCRIDGATALDVVVTRAKFKPGTWTLSDRLGRPLGTITGISPSLFTIDADRNSGLFKMATASFPSLDSAMSAIATHMKGECQLSSKDE
jgi:hypothetical protein